MTCSFDSILRPGYAYLLMSRPTILCVDDYEASLAGWCLYLQSMGFSVITARTGQEALEMFAMSPVDVVMLDYAMPHIKGDEVAATMKQIKPEVRILMFSGVADVPEGAQNLVDAFLRKGLSPAVVLEKIRELLPSTQGAA
jgi:CheY-like chemotaxis protein